MRPVRASRIPGANLAHSLESARPSQYQYSPRPEHTRLRHRITHHHPKPISQSHSLLRPSPFADEALRREEIFVVGVVDLPETRFEIWLKALLTFIFFTKPQGFGQMRKWGDSMRVNAGYGDDMGCIRIRQLG